MSTVVQALSYGTLFINIAILLGVLTYVIERFTDFELEAYTVLKEYLGEYSVKLSLGLAVVATTGSLYLSNMLEWTPCRLCWFQRIFMYPLVVILATGLFLDKDDIADYAMPLAMMGLPIAFYHSLEQRFTQYLSSGCSIFEVSCSTKYTFYFNYITVPVMAFTAFLGILILLWRFKKKD